MPTPLTFVRGRRTGVLLALAFALIGAGVVLLVALAHEPAAQGDGLRRPATRTPEDPMDITAVGTTTDAHIQVVDKKRPGRVASEFYFHKLDPIGSGSYRVAQPRTFVYLLDGRTVYIRADTGRVKMPSRADAPDSGEFSGNGLMLVFPARGSGALPIDVDRDTPGMIVRFQTVSFDTLLLELSTRDELLVETDKASAALQGALVRGNQAQDRLEFARLGPGWFRYRTERGEEPAGAASRAHSPAPGATGAEISTPKPAASDRLGPPALAQVAPTPAAPIKEDLYRSVFTGSVKVTQATRTLDSDSLTVWTRLLDNKLPEDAFGEPEDTAPEASATRPHEHAVINPAPATPESAVTQPLAPSTPPPPAGPVRTLFTARPTDVKLAWTRDMTMAPLATGAVPSELAAGNHLHARFQSDKSAGQGRITIADTALGAAGVCATLDYAATVRQLTLASGPRTNRVDLTVPGTGRVVGPLISFNLNSGVGHIPGAGTLISLHPDSPTVLANADPDAPLPEAAVRRITWSDQADFEMFTSNGAAEGILKFAQFTGSVLASELWSSLSADHLAADFSRVQSPGKDPQSLLNRLRLGGNAMAIGGPSPRRADLDRPLPAIDPYIGADTLDIHFEPAEGSDDPKPVHALAVGNVRVTDRKSSMTTDQLEAQLVSDANGDVGVGDLTANGHVRVDRTDGVWAEADTLIASGQERWANLTGAHVALGRGDSVMRGTQARLEETTGLLRFFNAGTFEHSHIGDTSSSVDPTLAALADPDLAPGTTRMRATWAREMLFVNTTGRIECHGDAEVTARSATGGQVARSERLFLNITPAPAEGAAAPMLIAPAADNDGETMLAGLDDRQLLSAEMVGAVTEREGGALASVKAWRYGISPSGTRTFDQVQYLESSRLLADEVLGTLTVPDAGRGVIFDAGGQSATAGSIDAAQPPQTAGPSGDSRFTWRRRLDFNRRTGDLNMLEAVELEHLPPGSTEKLVMRCPDLAAKFDMGPGGGGRMLSARCTGGAYAESGPRLLSGDEFTYDGPTDTLRAFSLSDTPVMFTDTRRGAPVLAKRLTWDRRTDRIEVQEPMPVTGPMNR